MTFNCAAAVPFGYDSGLFEDEQLVSFTSVEDIMQQQIGQLLDEFDIESPAESFSSHITWETAKSPGRGSLQPSNTNSSRSPGTGSSVVFTPTSTLHDYHGEAAQPIEDPESSEKLSTSPDSNVSPVSDDYVYLNVFGEESSVRREMNNRPPPSGFNLGSGVVPSSSDPHSRLPSVAPSIPPSEDSRSQWPSFTSVSSTGWMEQSNRSQIDDLNLPTSSTSSNNATGVFGSDLLADVGTFRDSYDNEFLSDLPFRSLDDGGEALLQAAYLHSVPFAPHLAPTHVPGTQQQYVDPRRRMQHQVVHTSLHTAPSGHMSHHSNASGPLLYQHRPTVQHLQPHMRYAQGQMGSTVIGTTTPAQPRLYRNRHAPYPQYPSQLPQAVERIRHAPQPSQQVQTHGSAVSIPTRPLQPAIPGPSRQQMISSSQAERSRKGGRSKNSHLPVNTREKSHKMRKAGACWRCALQRDTCPDEGTPCQRCVEKSQKNSFIYFPCNRSKLPDFVYDFLPPSMTLMHQKQTIEDCVEDQVYGWDLENSVDVFFTSGYGPALRWKLHEFRPRSDELLLQYQYLQDIDTGKCEKTVKYSPPLGLRKLDTSDDIQFEKYLNDLLDPYHLRDFGQTCFEEETQIDDFQASLMKLLCDLYLDMPQDTDLQDLLGRVIRMMVVTYIMGHTLTLVESTLYGVLDTIKYSHKPTPNEIMTMTHTSPRLANRQLKFFFCILRTQMIEKILIWSQQTLHSSGKKEATWLPSFCVMLGLAMTVEELQRTLHIQADAKSSKKEMTVEAADIEALNACERMDADFKLMVGLFRCKYRDKTWGVNGTFGNGTPELQDPASVAFLTHLRSLLLVKREHLQRRKDVTLGKDNQCLYTSRLVAEFLLPFLNL